MDARVIDWRRFETVLLDMDGTILDLAFDNYFWRELLPRSLARARRIDPERARRELFEQYSEKTGSLDWYCVDYWTNALGIDVRALKSAASHRVRYLPGARAFLADLTSRHARVVLVTNAHGFTLDVKRAVAGLGQYFDRFVSAHEFGVPKEHADFWPALRDALEFEPASTVFIDDSESVLAAALASGIGMVIGISRPDSQLPASDGGGHLRVNGVADLLGRSRQDTIRPE